MIDTKIACQCGNRFKFGMDLVNGRAPDGLVCPTCGAPATPACNALVDFLAGKEPPPIGTGSRPLKEIRVVCACGARYKFDLELAEKEMPGAVTCPGCQADLTPVANEEIRTYIAKHAAEVATPATAPAPAAPPPGTAPVTPATGLVPASTTSSAPSVPAALPASDPAPAPAAAPSAPASNTSVPATASPEVPAAAAAAASAVTPVSDPFGPAPTGKSSGPNLKPLDVPKPNRPPPGSRPATPPGAPATAAKSTKPDAAKPTAKPTVKPAAASGTPNVGLGVAGAVAGALIGAALWFAVLKLFPTPTDPKAATPVAAWMAILTGVLAGFGARLLGRSVSPQLGGAACVSTTLVIFLMVWVATGHHIDRQMAPQLASSFKATLERAQAAVNAKTDAELRPFVAQSAQVADMETARVSDEAIKAYRATELPKLKEFLADKDNRAKFEARQRALYRSMYPFEDVWQETFGIFGLLFLLGGIIAAAKIAMK